MRNILDAPQFIPPKAAAPLHQVLANFSRNKADTNWSITLNSHPTVTSDESALVPWLTRLFTAIAKLDTDEKKKLLAH